MSDDLIWRGYAPGSYCCTCHTCNGQFVGDKRAYCCKGCAISADRIEELEAKLAKAVDALEHIADIETDPDNMGRFHDIANAAIAELTENET